ncbi:uncharacterized protein LOC123563516 [Mercenaria mercenaria]|uniref:uncharacterized protein LOC123563516 n=1 Tax=Mercenaria mercenaria TaxID=6596 RepID=UPI00234F1654|nr:uncharacterized protein LOC123563516 [Mercenaria mercenaria]
MARCLFMMRCVSAPDRLLFFRIARHSVDNGCPGLTAADTCFRQVKNSTRRYHILCKKRGEKHFDSYSVMKMILSRLSGKTANQSILSHFTSYSYLSVYINQKTAHRNLSSSFKNTAAIKDDNHDTDSDSDEHIKPALDSVIPSIPTPTHVDIIPGKGPPPEPPVDCCMSGCANCVWIQYAEELKQYYSLEKGSEMTKKAIEQIENPGLQMFLKLELGLL